MLRQIRNLPACFGFLLISGNVFAAARLEPLTVGNSNFTGTYGPLWLAVEECVGTKYG